ncbi:tyrosine-type recombinase/integrase [Glycomyces sp. NPDC048151]|uniref:tyrosine-type recombinase/integrase n=1 Tax=Glycomyces sp. NPDC048151 TaxID=3364002 RepID=UPI0037207FBB
MGYAKKRCLKKGIRYTAVFVDADGYERSAGTYDTKKEADKEWKAAEAKVNEGRGQHLIRGRVLFQTYVERDWLPNLTVEVKTLENYFYQLYSKIMPTFGQMRMLDIYPIDIKRWLTKLKKGGVSAATRKYLKILLSTIMTSAVSDEVRLSNPCLLVKTDPVPKKPLVIVSPEQFDAFYNSLPDDMSKLLVETDVETGMRWGELTELRVHDFDQDTNVFTVQRAVVMVNSQFHPEGKRFLVKEYPKDKEYRLIKVDPILGQKFKAHIRNHNLKSNDLLFWYDPPKPPPATDLVLAKPGALGQTEPNEKGRTYQHGTLSGYTAGKCRLDCCKAAMADYRRNRRAEGKDSPRRPRVWDTDGHIPSRWFRDRIIKPALQVAGIKIDIRMHLLRHAHASWLLNGGADLVVVKERLGHASIITTERYLHTLSNADETALAALNKVRKQRCDMRDLSATGVANTCPEPTSITEVLAEMARLQEVLGKLAAQEGGQAV